MSTLDLFDGPVAPYARGSVTSRAAAEAIGPKLRRLEMEILQCLLAAPLVIDEIAAKLGKHLLTVRPRISELKEAGLLEVTKDVGASALGHKQSVVRLTPKGKQVLAENSTDGSVAGGGTDITTQRSSHENENAGALSSPMSTQPNAKVLFAAGRLPVEEWRRGDAVRVWLLEDEGYEDGEITRIEDGRAWVRVHRGSHTHYVHLPLERLRRPDVR